MAPDKTIPEDSTILLTGGSGFLGRAILHELLGELSIQHLKEVRVLDINPPDIRFAEQLRFIKGDIRDINLLQEACKGVDVVIHSAAIVDWGTKSD